MKIADKSSTKSISKRLRHIAKVLYFMLHKGITKHRIVMIVGKVIRNPMKPFEFSCSNTPISYVTKSSSCKNQCCCRCDLHVPDSVYEVAPGEEEYGLDMWSTPGRREEGGENQVDREAEEFIRKFYEQLRLQEGELA